MDYKTNDKLFGSLGHLTEEGIAVCVDAIRANSFDDLPIRVLHHIDACVKCKNEILDTLPLVEEESYEDSKFKNRLLKSVGLPAKDFSFAYRAAAVIIIGVSVGILVYLLQSLKADRDLHFDSKKTVEVQRDENKGDRSSEIGQVEQRGDFADNFEISPTLESLVNSVPRSTSISVHSPKIGEKVKRGIAFDWAVDEAGVLRLKIFSNRGKELYSFARLKSRLLFNGALKPGLYYWKLEDEKDLLYVGKFFVE